MNFFNDVWLGNQEVVLRNTTFLTLFLTMIFYWFETAFFVNKKTETKGANLLPAGITIKPLTSIYDQKEQNTLMEQPSSTSASLMGLPISLSKLFMLISNVALIILLLVRWKISGHFPLSNLYESLMFLAWCLSFLHLILFPSGKKSNHQPAGFLSVSPGSAILNGPSKNPLQNQDPLGRIYNQEKIFGSIIAPSALLMNGFACFNLPKEMQQAAPLVPALQSNWLMMHVTVMIISYATLIIGSLLSIAFLILHKILEKKLLKAGETIVPVTNISQTETSSYEQRLSLDVSSFAASGIAAEASPRSQAYDKFLTTLDFLSYRIIGLGFPFLTIGILSGAVWANEAWGSYWSWDPKETWALLTWLVFAIYLHSRLTKGPENSQKPAIIASVGFIVVWFCYLGVNLIGEGLHSYGFFK